MKLRGKIKAVTLTEMLVVLAITAIVASLAFTVLNYFTKSMNAVNENYAKNTSLHGLEQQLTTDFNHYTKARYDLKKDKLILSTPLDSITYSFEEAHLLRESDTLYSGNLLYQKYYLGETTIDSNMDALKISITQGALTKNLFVSQPKSTAVLWD